MHTNRVRLHNQVNTRRRPQSRLDASDRIDKAIADLGDWRGERLAEIRKLIHEVDPAVVEEWKWMGTPVWSHEGMYALANAHKDKVKLTFFHAAQLPDPKKLFNAMLDGNKWRAIDFGKGNRINKPALKALLRAAVTYNENHAVELTRFGGHPIVRGSRPQRGVHRGEDTPTVCEGVSSGGSPVGAGVWQVAGGDREGSGCFRTIAPHLEEAGRSG